MQSLEYLEDISKRRRSPNSVKNNAITGIFVYVVCVCHICTYIVYMDTGIIVYIIDVCFVCTYIYCVYAFYVGAYYVGH